MKYFEHNFNVKIIQSEYSELDSSWGLKDIVDPFTRLYYISGGRGRVLCGKQNVGLEKGKLYLLPSQTALTFWTTNFLNVYWSHVQLMLAPGIDIFNIIKGKVMCIPEPDNNMVKGFESLYLDTPGVLYDSLRSQALIMEIIASFFKRYDIELPERFKKDIRRFEAIASLVEDSPGNKWSIQELAAKSGLGRVRFSTEFKRVFGVPPAKFIMRKRLERARYLLLATGRTLEDIAEELGFSDAFHLSKSFKADTGLSPKEFRKSRHINQP